ncbi:MAG: 50S ribosomal protein L29 [Candidatus Wallbacteria bacterium]|nr:50S ribosomal protein L29 [Candidatus Wallbacteria bacterium]
MKAKELRELTPEELADKYRGFKDELFNLRFQLATGQLEKVARIRQVRRDLARVLAIMHQRTVESGNETAGGRK